MIKRTKRIPTFPAEEKVLQINNSTRTEQEEIPWIIWMYWEGEKLPTIVEKSIQNIRLLHPGHSIILLNKDTILNFLPDFMVTTEMPLPNKTDLIRLELLYKFGGIWLDASVIMKGNLDWVHEVQTTFNPDLIAYYRESGTVDSRFPVIESWLLAAPKNNAFIKAWLAEFSPIKVLGSRDYFERIKNRGDFEDIRQKIQPVAYLLVYLACQIAMRKGNSYNFYLKRCEDSALFIQEFYKWDARKINYALCRFTKPVGDIPIIKLTNRDRNYLQPFFDAGMVKRGSVLGRFFL